MELEYKIIRLNLRYKVIRFRWEIMKFLLHMRLKIRLTDTQSNEVQFWSIKQMFWKRNKVFSFLNRLNWLGWPIFHLIQLVLHSIQLVLHPIQPIIHPIQLVLHPIQSIFHPIQLVLHPIQPIELFFYSTTIFFNLKHFK